MKSWRVLLGLAAACAACCAIPLLGLAGGLAAFGSAVAACADELVPLGIALLIAAAGLAAWWAWRRRRSAASAGCGCAQQACATGAERACS